MSAAKRASAPHPPPSLVTVPVVEEPADTGPLKVVLSPAEKAAFIAEAASHNRLPT